MDKDRIWRIVLGEIEVGISKASFSTWFAKTELLDLTDTKAIIGVPNNFHKEYLQKHFDKQIKQLLLRSLPNLRSVEYEVRSGTQLAPAIPEEVTKLEIMAKAEVPEQKTTVNKLNPKYTFESFVVGENSRIAQAASEQAARNPGITYNPLLIYGGVGLGKTHLLQAVGNEFARNYPKKTVLYVTSEHFTNEYVDSIRNQTTREFRNKYRKVDCLLVDDIQFLAGKEGAQEAFFWTFNTLYEDGRQIVIVTDQLPKHIPALEERLRSRLEWGLMVDISPPDYETRLAILQAKAESLTPAIPDDVLKKIANMVSNNVRELEGALTRISAYAQLNQSVPTADEVESLLGGLVASSKRKTGATSAEILKAVARFYNIGKEELIGKKRNKEIVLPRQIAIYLLREELDMPYKQIGDIIGGRDHTTVMHDYKKIKKLLVDDVEKLGELKKIKNSLYNK